MPSISVIIPTYNRAEALVRAVESCLAQTHAVHEVLVCDDGSTDASEQRIARIGKAQVKWLQGPRAGRPAVPRNRGIAAATGEWVAFLDDDDAWMPDKIATQLARCAADNVDACCTNAECIDPAKGSKGNYFNAPSSTISFTELLAVNKVICSSMLVRKAALVKAGGFPEEPHMKAFEDYALWLRLSVFTDIAYVNAPLVLYNDAPATTLRSEGLDAIKQREAVLVDLLGWATTHRGAINARQRSAIARHLRAAMRVAGRPIWHRLFIR